MYVNVQRAAARLGVSVVTIRRWTASGFLPCTRTPGGHRRISTDDLDELARFIGSSDVLAAKAAREHELETVVDTSIALGGRLELPELLAEIAHQITRILHTDYCTVYEYDPQERLVRMLADYDSQGGRFPATGPYLLEEFPLTARVIDEQITATVDTEDPNADPAEVATLRADNDRSMMMVPIVHQGKSIGALETIDHEHRRDWTPQEIRMTRAIATQAGVAIANARRIAEIRTAERQLAELERQIVELGTVLGDTVRSTSLDEFLNDLAQGLCRAFDCIACIAAAAGQSAGATTSQEGDDAEPAHVSTSRDHSQQTDLTITLTRRQPPNSTTLVLLQFATMAASGHLRGSLDRPGA